MKTIFTYPFNYDTSYVDPDYLGDANSGLHKRFDELLAGTYKDWNGLDPVSDLNTTALEWIDKISQYEQYVVDNGYTDQITMFDFWRLPFVVASKNVSAGPNNIIGGTVNLTTDTLTTGETHTFQTNDLATFTDMDGPWGQLYNGKDVTVNRISDTEMSFVYDGAFINILPTYTFDNHPTNPSPIRPFKNNSAWAGSGTDEVQVFFEPVAELSLNPSDTVSFPTITGTANLPGTYYTYPDVSTPGLYFIYKDAAHSQPVTNDDIFPADSGQTFTVNKTNPGSITLDSALVAPSNIIFVTNNVEWKSGRHSKSMRDRVFLKSTTDPLTFEVYRDAAFTAGYNWVSTIISNADIIFNTQIEIEYLPYESGLPTALQDPFDDGDAVTFRNIIQRGTEMNDVDYYVERMHPTGHNWRLYKDVALTQPLLRSELTVGNELYEYQAITHGSSSYQLQSTDGYTLPTEGAAVVTAASDFWDFAVGDEIYPPTGYNITQSNNIASVDFTVPQYSAQTASDDLTVKIWSDVSELAYAPQANHPRVKVHFLANTESNSGLNNVLQYLQPTGNVQGNQIEFEVYSSASAGTARQYSTGDGTNRVTLTPIADTNPALATLSRELLPYEYNSFLDQDILDEQANVIVAAGTKLTLTPTDNDLEYEINTSFVSILNSVDVAVDNLGTDNYFDIDVTLPITVDLGETFIDGGQAFLTQHYSTQNLLPFNVEKTVYTNLVSGTTYNLWLDQAQTIPFTVGFLDVANISNKPVRMAWDQTTQDYYIAYNQKWDIYETNPNDLNVEVFDADERMLRPFNQTFNSATSNYTQLYPFGENAYLGTNTNGPLDENRFPLHALQDRSDTNYLSNLFPPVSRVDQPDLSVYYRFGADLIEPVLSDEGVNLLDPSNPYFGAFTVDDPTSWIATTNTTEPLLVSNADAATNGTDNPFQVIDFGDTAPTLNGRRLFIVRNVNLLGERFQVDDVPSQLDWLSPGTSWESFFGGINYNSGFNDAPYYPNYDAPVGATTPISPVDTYTLGTSTPASTALPGTELTFKPYVTGRGTSGQAGEKSKVSIKVRNNKWVQVESPVWDAGSDNTGIDNLTGTYGTLTVSQADVPDRTFLEERPLATTPGASFTDLNFNEIFGFNNTTGHTTFSTSFGNYTRPTTTFNNGYPGGNAGVTNSFGSEIFTTDTTTAGGNIPGVITSAFPNISFNQNNLHTQRLLIPYLNRNTIAGFGSARCFLDNTYDLKAIARGWENPVDGLNPYYGYFNSGDVITIAGNRYMMIKTAHAHNWHTNYWDGDSTRWIAPETPQTDGNNVTFWNYSNWGNWRNVGQLQRQYYTAEEWVFYPMDADSYAGTDAEYFRVLDGAPVVNNTDQDLTLFEAPPVKTVTFDGTNITTAPKVQAGVKNYESEELRLAHFAHMDFAPINDTIRYLVRDHTDVTPRTIAPLAPGDLDTRKLMSASDTTNLRPWYTHEDQRMVLTDYTISDHKFHESTQGYDSNGVGPTTTTVTWANFEAPTEGIVELSPNGNITYIVDNVDVISGGNQRFKYLDVAGVEQNGAKTSADAVYHPGTELKAKAAIDTAATFDVTVDSNGRLSGVTAATAGVYNDPRDMLLRIESQDDLYVEPVLTLAQQADVWDTQDQWVEFGEDNTKVWPSHVTPNKAEITQTSPSVVSTSQSGIKFVRTSSFTTWNIEVSYPPLSADEFKQFHAISQAVAGQAVPFLLPLTNTEGYNIVWGEFGKDGTEKNLIFRNNYAAGTDLVLVEGFDSFAQSAFESGEVFFAETQNNQNGNLSTVVNNVDANAYGEAKIRLAYPLRSDVASGDAVTKHPDYAVVTLNANDFNYSVDTNGYYYLQVGFTLDGWK